MQLNLKKSIVNWIMIICQYENWVQTQTTPDVQTTVSGLLTYDCDVGSL